MTLQRNHIELGDSVKGIVTSMPQVPGVIKLTQDVNNPANEPVHQQQPQAQPAPQQAPPPQEQPQQPQQPQR